MFVYKQLWFCACLLYLVNPVVEGRDSGEDSGFLLIVAAKGGHKASNTVHLPDTFSILTVQRATRVTLEKVGNRHRSR